LVGSLPVQQTIRIVVATTNADRPFVLSRGDREQFRKTANRDRSNRRGPFYAARDPRSHGDSQMLNRLLPIALLAIPLASCSAVGQLTIKDYQAKSGQRVMAGQAEPKSEYQCQKLAQEKQDWGFKGNLDRAAAIERVTSVAVDAAPAKGANYVYVMAPSEKSIGGFNLNAFSDAQVAYYKCASLPAHGS
jgi:hypothetical protein